MVDAPCWRLRAAQAIVPVAAVTALYNVTMRTGADLLAAAGADGIAFCPWHPVTTTDDTLADRARQVLAPIAEAHGAAPQQVALAWHLSRSPVSVPIPGTTSLAHLWENLAAQAIVLTDAETAAITAISPEP
jgi:aryl-alcohol dehydrogenase-like predicted oxidoreductase